MPIIAVRDLTKGYRYHQKAPGLRGSLASVFHRQTLEKTAVAGINFTIEAGEVVGFLGANGAGKTTTLKMLCGLLYPSSGDVRVLGHVPSRRETAFLRQIALVMGQKNMLWWDIPALETLLLHKEMYGIPEARFRRTLDELAGLLEVEPLLRVQVRKLSLGERMKMELLAALIHRPAIVFLDEPTIGLDLVAQQRVRQFLHRLNREQGTTILLTSHSMDDIEALCPRVLLIDRGRLHFDGSLSALVAQAAPSRQVIAVFADPVADVALAAALDGVGQPARDDQGAIRVAVPRERVAETADRLLRAGRLVDLRIEDEPVEAIVRQIFTAARAREDVA